MCWKLLATEHGGHFPLEISLLRPFPTARGSLSSNSPSTSSTPVIKQKAPRCGAFCFIGGEGGITRALRPSPLRGRRHSRRSARPAVACRTARLIIESSNPPSIIHRKRGTRPLFLWMAEREGFEPSIRDYRIHTFQACSFNHSDTSPDFFNFPALTEITAGMMVGVSRFRVAGDDRIP